MSPSSPVIEIDGAVSDMAEGDAFSGSPRLAVIPFKLMGITSSQEQEAGTILADLLLAEIDSDAFDLYERSRLKDLLAEQKLGESDLAARDGLAVRFGKLAGIRYVVLGSLSRLGYDYHLSARVVDCQTGRIGGRGAVSFDSLNAAPRQLPELVNLLGLRQGSGGIHAPQPAHAPNVDDLIAAIGTGEAFNVRLRVEPEAPFYEEGQLIHFVIEADRDCFVTLLSVDPAGKITLLLPNAWQPRAFIRRNTSMTIPAPDAGFRFTIQPPHGETLVKAIATLQPLRIEGVDELALKESRFMPLAGTKGIGIEATPKTQGATAIDALNQILPQEQWAGAEKMVVTRESIQRDKP